MLIFNAFISNYDGNVCFGLSRLQLSIILDWVLLSLIGLSTVCNLFFKISHFLELSFASGHR